VPPETNRIDRKYRKWLQISYLPHYTFAFEFGGRLWPDLTMGIESGKSIPAWEAAYGFRDQRPHFPKKCKKRFLRGWQSGPGPGSGQLPDLFTYLKFFGNVKADFRAFHGILMPCAQRQYTRNRHCCHYTKRPCWWRWRICAAGTSTTQLVRPKLIARQALSLPRFFYGKYFYLYFPKQKK
jgi:hypothetical protein